MKPISLIMVIALCLHLPVSAFTKNPRLTSIPDNTALDLGAYACNQPIGNSSYCEAITDYSGFTYDKHHHLMLMFGGGHASTFRDDVDVFNFDSLKWIPAYNSTPCAAMVTSNLDNDKGCWISSNHPFSRHTYDLLVVTENTAEFLLLRAGGGTSSFCVSGPEWYPSGRAGHYDPVARTWTFGATMNSLWSNLACAESDPVSGLVIVLSEQATTGLWTYDPAARTATRRLAVSNLPGYANNLIYFPPNDKFYMIDDGNSIYEVTPDRTDWASSRVTQVAGITGTVPSTQETGFAYDSVNQIIGGGVRNSVFYAFNPITRTWTSKSMQASPSGAIGTQAYHAIDYDPVNNVFVFITEARRTWAYRYTSGATSIERKTNSLPIMNTFYASPNPFRSAVTLSVQNVTHAMTLQIYDMNGGLAADLSREMANGSVTWKPKCRPGVYVVRITTGGRTCSRRLFLVK